MADAVLGQIFDWIYGKLAGFFSEFFEMMNMMGAELFDLPWTQAVVLFFSRFAWMLYAVGLVVAGFEYAIQSQSARGDLRRHFAVKYLRHSVQAVREILDRVGHGVCVFREKSGYRLRLPCVSLLTYRSISCRSFRYRKQSLYCSLSSSTSRTLRSELL